MYVEVHLDLLARNTCVHVPIRIILVAHLSAITIINYNQLAPMCTPKLQLIKHRSDQMDLTLDFRIIEVDQIRRR